MSRKHKYNAKPVYVDGVRFDSKAELRRWRTLQLLERAGHISKLQRQVAYPLCVKGVKLGTYRADHVYVEHGEVVVEDVKGFKTPLYRWKKKHMAAQYNIEIREV